MLKLNQLKLLHATSNLQVEIVHHLNNNLNIRKKSENKNVVTWGTVRMFFCVSPYCWVRFWECECIGAFDLLEPKWKKHLEPWELLREKEKHVRLEEGLKYGPLWYQSRGDNQLMWWISVWIRVCVCRTSLSVKWSRSVPHQGASWCYWGHDGAAAGGRDWDQQSGEQQYWQFWWRLIMKQTHIFFIF